VGLDDRPLSTYTVDQITTLLEQGQDGQKHTLEIVRDGRRKKLKLVMQSML